ncbi:MAG: AAA family ATPase [Candidatus Angelobacter sp.]
MPDSQSKQNSSAPDIPAPKVTLWHQWGVLTFAELNSAVQTAAATEFIIDGLIPKHSIAVLLGQSGIGKTPLVYQKGLCVASAIPFLGRAVKQGSVLFVDFENGVAQVRDMVQRLAAHLGLSRIPENCHFWNINNCPDGWSSTYHIENLVKDLRPSFVVIDSLSGWKPEMERDTEKAIAGLQELRGFSRKYGCTFEMIVHPRKAPAKESDRPPPLENANIFQHFEMARGAAALINASDVRLAVDRPALFGLPQHDGLKQEAALILRGFRRIEGEIPTIYITRVIGDDGEPLGYGNMSSVALLNNADQIAAFERLPSEFSFKTATQVYKKADSPTREFLKKAIAQGLLYQPARGRYIKVAVTGADGENG